MEKDIIKINKKEEIDKNLNRENNNHIIENSKKPIPEREVEIKKNFFVIKEVDDKSQSGNTSNIDVDHIKKKTGVHSINSAIPSDKPSNSNIIKPTPFNKGITPVKLEKEKAKENDVFKTNDLIIKDSNNIRVIETPNKETPLSHNQRNMIKHKESVVISPLNNNTSKEKDSSLTIERPKKYNANPTDTTNCGLNSRNSLASKISSIYRNSEVIYNTYETVITKIFYQAKKKKDVGFTEFSKLVSYNYD